MCPTPSLVIVCPCEGFRQLMAQKRSNLYHKVGISVICCAPEGFVTGGLWRFRVSNTKNPIQYFTYKSCERLNIASWDFKWDLYVVAINSFVPRCSKHFFFGRRVCSQTLYWSPSLLPCKEKNKTTSSNGKLISSKGRSSVILRKPIA